MSREGLYFYACLVGETLGFNNHHEGCLDTSNTQKWTRK